jgi:hypothetical protein
MKDPLHGNTRVSYLIGLSFFSSTDHNRIIMIRKGMNVISKSKSTIGSSNLVKDGTIYRTSDLYDDTKRFANFNYNYTDKSELRRIRSTNTELKKVINSLFT